jgi:hypothetical protein
MSGSSNDVQVWHIAMPVVGAVHRIRSGSRDEACKPGVPEQRKLRMRTLIDGLKYSNLQIFQKSVSRE